MPALLRLLVELEKLIMKAVYATPRATPSSLSMLVIKLLGIDMASIYS